MNKLFLIALLFIFSFHVYAQTTTYYKDQYLRKETTAEKASYSLTTTKLPDGRTLNEIRDIKKDITIRCEDNYGEPFGIWYIETNFGLEKLNFDFELNYKDTACNANRFNAGYVNTFEDNDSLGYTAPVLAGGEKNFSEYLSGKLNYPVYARENGIEGRVILSCTLSVNGTMEKIAIIKGDHVSLNKEAARVLRKMKFSSPPKLNGIPQSFCLIVPIVFRFQ